MPKTLTAADFLSLRMQYRAARAENEWPAAIEHDFADGRMVDHYFVVPGPAVTEDDAGRDLGPVTGFCALPAERGGVSRQTRRKSSPNARCRPSSAFEANLKICLTA